MSGTIEPTQLPRDREPVLRVVPMPADANSTGDIFGGWIMSQVDIAGSIPALVNVNLQNVLNDLSVAISVDRANIPVNAQVPIEIAANVCGVSVSALAASIASGQAGCTATTSSPQLAQAVQQQVAAGGDVQGGDQTMGTPTSNVI